MLIELLLSGSALLLYPKTRLRSLIAVAASIWLAYMWKPLAAALAVSLILLWRESAAQASIK